MQDRFKFRIFEYETKEMVELDAVGYSSFDPFAEGKSRLIMIPSGLGNTFHYDKQCLYDNDKFSEPMQCTGLKDKNGKLIYEGDIVRDKCSEAVATIEYLPYTFSLMAHIRGMDDYLPLEDICYALEVATPFEVIGNIYENPELLEVSNEH